MPTWTASTPQVIFEASMSNVEALSGATGEELTALSDKAKEMGATTKFTAGESADALSYMALAAGTPSPCWTASARC